jgi:RNA 3'-terminal phosphate cyclase
MPRAASKYGRTSRQLPKRKTRVRADGMRKCGLTGRSSAVRRSRSAAMRRVVRMPALLKMVKCGVSSRIQEWRGDGRGMGPGAIG